MDSFGKVEHWLPGDLARGHDGGKEKYGGRGGRFSGKVLPLSAYSSWYIHHLGVLCPALCRLSLRPLDLSAARLGHSSFVMGEKVLQPVLRRS